ncbi:hypothetical protein BX600DRAFT_466187 [Xylariales sp. PMI_506]|nr:hypothetical protein BX600DRAFT_466187 [Xylariales sp. PMI_506]
MANASHALPQSNFSSRSSFSTVETGHVKSSHHSADTGLASPYEVKCNQLREYIQKLRSLPLSPKQVDLAYKEYAKVSSKAERICIELLRPQPLPLLSPELISEKVPASVFDTASLLTFDTRTSLGLRTSTDTTCDSPFIYEQHIDLIQKWVGYVEDLASSLHGSLTATYREWEPEVSPPTMEQIFNDKGYRSNAIARMRSVGKARLSAEVIPNFEIRLRSYDKLRDELFDLQSLLQKAQSGISPDRDIHEISISPRGDSILEFANKTSEDYPVFRFRVSSHMLAETSPIFAIMFGDDELTRDVDTETACSLPPPPSQYVSRAKPEAKLYRMPQLELNAHGSLETLLHAAHLHNDMVPREIEYEKFVALAEVCMRYQCTSPVELSVEHRWLPQWVHKATEDMPDGLLLVTYAFGLRRLFTRLSKTVIMNITDEHELDSKPWPRKIKEKVWAIRTAKVDQVYACCSNILQEYILSPSTTDLSAPRQVGDQASGLLPTSKPRCPKGSHACDAAALGWLMLLFNEMHILTQIMTFPALGPDSTLPKRSLNQLVDSLRFMASPPQVHRGVCDYAPAFRSSINDIYNSLSGITLADVSGKHGWALSRHKSLSPQPVLTFPAARRLADADAAKRARENVALQVLQHLDNLDDVYNAAIVDTAFFRAFKSNELAILKGLIRKADVPQRWTLDGARNKKEARQEMKVLRVESDKRSKEADYAQRPLCEASIDGSEIDIVGLGEASDDDDQTGSESATKTDWSELRSLQDDSEENLTREEAERILWSGTDDGTLSTVRSSPWAALPHRPAAGLGQSTECSEKFLAGDPAFRAPEEKHLVISENKNLRYEHDQKIGRGKSQDRENQGL